MKTPAPADLQRWTEEVARDSSSLAFLPLARAYRRMGRREAALQLCLRGLEHYPQHAEAHALLALLHLERGDRERAADEWSVVLRLDANNFEALRGLGFSCLEQDQLSKARQLLERAALLRPGDAAVQEALRLLGARQERESRPAWGSAGSGTGGWAFVDTSPEVTTSPASPAASVEPGSAPGPAFTAHSNAAAPPGGSGQAGGSASGASYEDPGALFDSVIGSGPLLGVLLLDARGLVLAGRLDDAAQGEALGALLGGVIEEGVRVARHLALGAWSGLLLETDSALLHVAPSTAGTLVVLARRDAPTGWLLRTAAHAATLATQHAEAQT